MEHSLDRKSACCQRRTNGSRRTFGTVFLDLLILGDCGPVVSNYSQIHDYCNLVAHSY